jgi:Cu(I)/Ag(I) efflux system membrane fusion protein
MKTKLKFIAPIMLALIVGYWLGNSRTPTAHPESPAVESATPTEYTCSMHPQIRQPNPGLCPLCAMDLIPVGNDGGVDPGPRSIALSASARELARIETTRVKRGEAIADLSLAGVLAYDTTRSRDVVLLSEGQIRTLYANVLGMSVKVGDPLAEVYSPDVFAASSELAVAGLSSPQVADSARRKLRLLGVDEEQIRQMEKTGKADETYMVRSPIDGVVVMINGHQGHWLMKGDDLVELSDPSLVWAHFDVYEMDIGKIRIGQAITITVEAYPGESFSGEIVFIPSELDLMTRGVKVRADIPNPDGRLKPGMFTRAQVQARLADDVVLIPASAVLSTGKRAITYVQAPDDESVFEGRVVSLGPRIGDRYVVMDGMEAGERVVTRGAMRIDSSLQLLAKPSMMSLPSEGGAKSPQTHCPVEGGKIDREVFVDYEGKRIYFCCPGCDQEFLDDPEAFLKKMDTEGIEPELVPAEGGGHGHHE